MPFHHLSSVSPLWRGALGMVGIDCQRSLEVGKTNMLLSASIRFGNRNPIADRDCAGNRAPAAAKRPGQLLAQRQSPGDGGADLWIRLWNYRSHPISASRPDRCHGISVPAEAALDCASASPADATGAALPLQYPERDYYAGRARQTERSRGDAATPQLYFEKYVDQGHSAKGSLVAGVGVSGELPGDRAGPFCG